MTVVAFPKPDHREVVSKPALAAILGRSTRWVELRMREGLPSTLENGVRRYSVGDVEAWLARRPRVVRVDRVGDLEERVGELERLLGEMRRTG